MSFVKKSWKTVYNCRSRTHVYDQSARKSPFLLAALRVFAMGTFFIFCGSAQNSLAMQREAEIGEGSRLFSFPPRNGGGTFQGLPDGHQDQDLVVEMEEAGQGHVQNGQPQQAPLNNRFQIMEFPQAEYALPAMIMYTLTDAPPPERPGWDIPSKFMHALDRAFFNDSRSREVLIAGIIGGTIGLVFPATPATGGILWSMGDEMGIPKSGALSGIIVSEIMITMTPVFARQLYERGQSIARYFTGETRFPPKEQGAHFDNKPHVYPPTALHTALKYVVGANAALEGAYYWAIVGIAEGAVYQNITFGMGWGLALALAERYYTVGERRLDRFFVRHHYNGEVINQHRKILITQAQRALNYLGQYPAFVNAVYDTVEDELGLGDAVDSEHFFALSALLIRHSMTVELENDSLRLNPAGSNEKDKEDPRLARYSDNQELVNIINENKKLKEELKKAQAEMDDLGLQGVRGQVEDALVDKLKPSTKEKITEYLSTFLIGAGSVSRLFGRQFMFERILENVFSVDPGSANIAAWCLASIHVTIRTMQEYDLQQNYTKSWLNAFSLEHLVDFQYLRKSVSSVSFLNGFFFAAANAGPTLAKFAEMSVAPSLQVLSVIPSFIGDIAYTQTYVDEYLNKLITAAATTRRDTTVALTQRAYPQMQPDLIWKRAKCHDWLTRLLLFLETADDETTELIYGKSQRIS